MTGIKLISPGEARMKINNWEEDEFMILDFRTPNEFKDGHLKNAININFFSETFIQDLEKLDKEKIYLIYCQTMNRSMPATNVMKQLEFQNVFLIDGGFMAWTQDGQPIIS